MKSLMLFIAAVIIAGGAGVAWHEAQLASDATRVAAVVAQKQSRTEAELQRMQQTLAAVEKEREELRLALAGLQKANAPVASAANPEKTMSVAARLSEYLRKPTHDEQKDPALQAIQLASARAKLVTSYGVLFRALSLSPAQIERFQNIVAKRDEQNMDLTNIILEEVAASNNKLSAETYSAVTKLKAQAESEYQDGMRELLGESGYQQLQEYDRTVVARDMASGFAAAAVMAGDPLTSGQAEQFTQLLAKASATYRNGGTASKETIDWSLVDPQARQILSASQWILFTTVDPPSGGRFGSQYANALNQALKAEAESRRAAASKPPGG